VLIVMIALLGLGMAGLFLTSGTIQMNTNINLRNQALIVAEAGIERAREVLNTPLPTAAAMPGVPFWSIRSRQLAKATLGLRPARCWASITPR
jgi:hypothetical protein